MTFPFHARGSKDTSVQIALVFWNTEMATISMQESGQTERMQSHKQVVLNMHASLSMLSSSHSHYFLLKLCFS